MWGNLINHTGAIVLKKPKAVSILKGFFYIIARDIDVKNLSKLARTIQSCRI